MSSKPLAVFIDTNICLHYPPLDKIDWKQWLGASEATLILCLPVLDELDRYKTDPLYNDRASRTLSLCDGASGESISTGFNLVTYVGKDPKSPLTGDPAILDLAMEYAAAFPAARVVVLTNDSGMSLRCRAAGIESRHAPRQDALEDPKSPMQRENERLKAQLDAEIRKRPRIEIDIYDPANPELKGPPRLTLTPPPKPTTFDEAFKLKGINPYWLQQHAHTRDFRQEYEQYENAWNARNLMIDESARTLTLGVRIRNAGQAPAIGVEVKLTLPESVIYVGLPAQSWGKRTTFPPIPLRSYPQAFQGLLTPIQTVPPDLHSNFRYPNMPFMIGDRELLFRATKLLHDQVEDPGNLFLTFASWEDVKPFSVSVYYRTEEPPLLSKDGRLTVIANKSGTPC